MSIFKMLKVCTIPSRVYRRLLSTKIGFIGLGHMGSSMAINLNKKFGNVMVFDRDEAKSLNLTVHGTKPAESVKEIAHECDTIITMLPGKAEISNLLENEGGIFQNSRPGTLIIDCTTNEPTTAEVLGTKADTKYQIKMIDAPVSGGVMGAAAGTLTFMVGGQVEDVEMAKPYLEAMGSKIIHCGSIGKGCSAKLCNNLAMAIAMIGTSEAMTLGIQSGLDPKLLTEIMMNSTGKSWCLEKYNPVPHMMPHVPSSHDYNGGFHVALMLKDLKYAMQSAEEKEVPLRMGDMATQMYEELLRTSMGSKDFSIIYDYIRKQAESSTK